jgi:hypothetical protein
MGEMRNAYSISVGRPRHRWEVNIRMDLYGYRVGGGGLDSSG